MNISYNYSNRLKIYLTRIDKLRTEMLTYPLSPSSEMRLKWNANLERIIWTLSLDNMLVSKRETSKILSLAEIPGKKLNALQHDVLGLRDSFNFIKENWAVKENYVTPTVIKKLYDLSCKPLTRKAKKVGKNSEKKIGQLLSYLQKGKIHPVILAGLSYAGLININIFQKDDIRVARLLPYLFLYKTGWDFREMLNLEEFYKRDLVTYNGITEMVKKQGNMTLFLEYFAYGVGSCLQKSFDKMKNLKFTDDQPASFWKINPRQKKVMEIMEKPGEKITNKDVQKIFAISQITASRDLSHLATLGLLVSRGKGRSVYYTRV